MAREFRDLSGRPFPAFKQGATGKIAYTGTAGTLAASLNTEKEHLVVVYCSSAAFIAVGAAPTATSNDRPIPADTEVPIVLKAGDKVSAIQQSSGGTLYVTELL